MKRSKALACGCTRAAPTHSSSSSVPAAARALVAIRSSSSPKAREEATRILAEKTLGKVRPIYTAFEEVRGQFLTDCETRLRPITVKLYRRHLTVHFPYGRKSIGDIEPREIVRRLDALKPSEKEHAHRIGRTFFRWCVGKHIIDRSPMETMARREADQPRDWCHFRRLGRLQPLRLSARDARGRPQVGRTPRLSPVIPTARPGFVKPRGV